MAVVMAVAMAVAGGFQKIVLPGNLQYLKNHHKNLKSVFRFEINDKFCIRYKSNFSKIENVWGMFPLK